jgi:pimeloyl-ACP methyl ester carboxylesterase
MPAYPVELAVRRWGSGSKRALLIHGICSSAQTWWEIADCLAADGMTVSAPDLRGHGGSPQASRYRAVDYAADIEALGESWDLVVGHSLGGLIAARSAQGPGFAQRMLLVDPVFELRADDFAEVTAANVSEALDPPSEARINAEHPGWHPEHARLKSEAAVQASPHAVERTMHDNAPWDHAALAERLACPTTILGGDPAVSCMFEPALGEALATRNPRLRYDLVAGTGHSVHRDRPDAVIAAIRDLMDGE